MDNKLKELIAEYNIEMEQKRMMAGVCMAYGLSQSEDAKAAWNSYDEHLANCKRLGREINRLSGKQMVRL